METIILFDPGIMSLNKGDDIIMRSALYELKSRGIIQSRFVVRCATHSPASAAYQNNNRNPRMKAYDDAAYKFICGSNLLWKDLFLPIPAFNVNLWNCRHYKNSIMMGVGLGKVHRKTNVYTKKLYGKILSGDYVHSTRDQAAAEFLESLGYRAIDTGCPTMWRFTSAFCAGIPCEKSESVVFTLTDYGRDPFRDQKMIDILREEYKHVYFWIQGAFDLPYYRTFEHTEGITLIPPDVDAYERFLSGHDADYVGTRLHAGLFAMQHKKRAIILAIDNRARDLSASYNLHVIERNDIDKLSDMIECSLATDVRIKQSNIEKWISQFREHLPSVFDDGVT